MAFPGTQARKLLAGGSGTARKVASAAALGFDLDDAGHFFSGLWQLIKAKATELAAYTATLLAALARKADELLPPETRSETLRRWLHVAVTVLIPAVLGALALYCLARCCWRCCCSARAARRRTMMVAPGRGGARMPRGVFEDNPRLYFRDLRAGNPLDQSILY
ncbi:uncharacterized protein LOC133893047 [Phragmites australis]|uniref:uncharacterized protein LOC133893047 n=1 Tax=Phragmites australis TaxID=29695 RepID=UPI002D783AFA|nr:uncharacterized protein LOC133893047 [Phragmites australis]